MSKAFNDKEYFYDLINDVKNKIKEDYKFIIKILITLGVIVFGIVGQNTIRSINNTRVVRANLELSGENHRIIKNLVTKKQVSKLIELGQFRSEIDVVLKSDSTTKDMILPLYHKLQNIENDIIQDIYGFTMRSGSEKPNAYIDRLQKKYHKDKGLAKLNYP